MSDDKNKQNNADGSSGNQVNDPVAALKKLGYTSVDIGGRTVNLDSIDQNIVNQNIDAGVGDDANQNTGGDPNVDKSGGMGDKVRGTSNQSQSKEGTPDSSGADDSSSDKSGFFASDEWMNYSSGDVNYFDNIQGGQNTDTPTNFPQHSPQDSKPSSNLTIDSVAKEMGIDYDPSQAFNPDSDSHKVYVEFQRRLLQNAVLQAQQLQAQEQQQKAARELFQKRVQKLVSAYPDMKSQDGGLDQRKFAAMVNYIRQLESSEDGLVIMREFVDFLSNKRLGSAVKQSQQTGKKSADLDDKNKQDTDNTQQSQQQIVVEQYNPKSPYNGQRYSAVIDVSSLQDYKRLFGG